MKPIISIVIPTKDGIRSIKSCIEGIMLQTIFQICEIIVIDSGSTDGTIEMLKSYPIKLHTIDSKDFNHGNTRNLGIELSEGEYILYTVQDAVPHDSMWIEYMYQHFSDSEVMGVCGQQIIPHNKTYNPHLWFRPQSKADFKSYQFKDETFKSLDGEEQKKYCSWDDVTAMYRKTFMQRKPFQPVMFGEDMLWAKEALSNGAKLVYDKRAKVEHYHHHYPYYTYNRTLIAWLFIYKTFDYIRPNPFKKIDYIKVIYRNIKWKIHPKWILHQWSLMFNMNKAVNDFKLAHRHKQLIPLEKKFKLNIPQGTTNS